jgi:hypothetical protein
MRDRDSENFSVEGETPDEYNFATSVKTSNTLDSRFFSGDFYLLRVVVRSAMTTGIEINKYHTAIA